jgi:hypothetical protein
VRPRVGVGTERGHSRRCTPFVPRKRYCVIGVPQSARSTRHERKEATRADARRRRTHVRSKGRRPLHLARYRALARVPCRRDDRGRHDRRPSGWLFGLGQRLDRRNLRRRVGEHHNPRAAPRVDLTGRPPVALPPCELTPTVRPIARCRCTVRDNISGTGTHNRGALVTADESTQSD